MSVSSLFPLQVLREARRRGERIAMISLHDAPTALLCCDAGVDCILVGDSLGNVVLGHDNTIPVTVEDMARHTAAVARGVRQSSRPGVPVVADLPFGSYATPEMAARHGAELMRAGAQALKLEGAHPAGVEAVRVLVAMGAPVLGHLGFTPQSALRMEGVVQGKTAGDATRLAEEARRLQDVGCCAVVLEAVPLEVAARITRESAIATIGIGSGPHCDGQVLVWNDLAGLSPGAPLRFVKRYAEARALLAGAARDYVSEVHAGAFPAREHGWTMPEAEREKWEPPARGAG